MGYVMAMGTCVSCRQPFSFNPHKVPSVVVNGYREPICKACVDKANPQRVANGLAPINVLPDAYEPLEESLL
jgi:hypothetical protein